MSTIENWINNYIIDKILEPFTQTEKFFRDAIWIAEKCEEIGLGTFPTAIISTIVAITIRTIIIFLPVIIIKTIINIFGHR